MFQSIWMLWHAPVCQGDRNATREGEIKVSGRPLKTFDFFKNFTISRVHFL
jgi:hypothetical protein